MKFNPSKILVLLGFMGAPALAQPPASVPRPSFGLSNRSKSQAANSKVILDVGIGSGQYPIVSMPMMKGNLSRVDGSTDPEDLQYGSGPLLDVKLGWKQRNNILPFSIIGGAQRISAAPGAKIPTASSYSRLHLETAGYFEISSTQTTLVPSIEARRSMYRNADSGHYVDSLLLKGSIEQVLSDDFKLSGSAGAAVMSRFGVLQNDNKGRSGALAESTTSQTELGAKAFWTPSKTASFHIGVTQESTYVTMQSNDGYLTYNLPVAPTDPTEKNRVLNLTVVEFVIGATKSF